jgi:sorbitol-specific phosphotransferase system component IIBC
VENTRCESEKAEKRKQKNKKRENERNKKKKIDKLLTILGRNGGLTFLASKDSQSISLKNGWILMAASAP